MDSNESTAAQDIFPQLLNSEAQEPQINTWNPTLVIAVFTFHSDT